MTKTVTVPANKCILCGHVWVQRKPGVPRQCPNPECRTTKWSEVEVSPVGVNLTPNELESIDAGIATQARLYKWDAAKQAEVRAERIAEHLARPANRDPFEGLV